MTNSMEKIVKLLVYYMQALKKQFIRLLLRGQSTQLVWYNWNTIWYTEHHQYYKGSGNEHAHCKNRYKLKALFLYKNASQQMPCAFYVFLLIK